MSARHVYEIHCDYQGCDRLYVDGDTRAADARRKAAAEDGFVYALIPVDGKFARPFDFCKEHACHIPRATTSDAATAAGAATTDEPAPVKP